MFLLLFYIWAPAPEELSARPWAEVYGICIIIFQHQEECAAVITIDMSGQDFEDCCITGASE